MLKFAMAVSLQGFRVFWVRSFTRNEFTKFTIFHLVLKPLPSIRVAICLSKPSHRLVGKYGKVTCAGHSTAVSEDQEWTVAPACQCHEPCCDGTDHHSGYHLAWSKDEASRTPQIIFDSLSLEFQRNIRIDPPGSSRTHLDGFIWVYSIDTCWHPAFEISSVSPNLAVDLSASRGTCQHYYSMWIYLRSMSWAGLTSGSRLANSLHATLPCWWRTNRALNHIWFSFPSPADLCSLCKPLQAVIFKGTCFYCFFHSSLLTLIYCHSCRAYLSCHGHDADPQIAASYFPQMFFIWKRTGVSTCLQQVKLPFVDSRQSCYCKKHYCMPCKSWVVWHQHFLNIVDACFGQAGHGCSKPPRGREGTKGEPNS